MTCSSVFAAHRSGPQVLQVVKNDLQPRSRREVRIRDLAAVDGWIKPVIAEFPILEAAQAYALLESGEALGNIVLVAPQTSANRRLADGG